MICLVHVHLAHDPPGVCLTEGATATLMACASLVESIVHVSLHNHAGPWPVLGVFIRADTSDLAVGNAHALWRLAVGRDPSLRGWRVDRVAVPPLFGSAHS